MAKKKVSKKKVKKKVAVAGKNRVKKFVNILLLVIFAYGLYLTLTDFASSNGIAIMAGAIVVWAVIKIVAKIRERK